MLKKVGLIIGPFPGRITGQLSPGGIATHIDGLINYLDGTGISTYKCYHKPYNIKRADILNSSPKEWFISVIHGIILLIHSKNFDFSNYSIRDTIIIAFYLASLKSFLLKVAPDFVHIHSLHNPAPIALGILNYRKPIIITDHGFWQHEGYSGKKSMIKLIKNYTLASTVIYISNIAYKKHISAKLGDNKKLVKIPNPTNFMKYPNKVNKENNLPKKEIFFNGYSESIERKGLDILLSTMNKYSELYDTIKLKIICDKKAENYIKNNSWKFEYALIERTTLEKILIIYCDVDLLVVPSRSESFGLVYTEALAVGIPVIGYFEVIYEFKKTLDNYIGESFNPFSEHEQDLRDKIVKCLNTPFDAHTVRDGLIKNYGWDVLGPRILDLYYPVKI